MPTTKEDIITLPVPTLRQPSSRVHVITDDTRQIIQDMTDAALSWEASRPHELAVALAAVQIGVLERIVIVRADFDDKANQDFIALINPQLIKREGTPTVIQPEGCLSVRDVYGNVLRYPKVRVKALNVKGQEVRIKADGFLAMLLQHEIDHTNGITFVDHIEGDHDAFYTLSPKGELEPTAYDSVAASGIFRQ